MASPDFQDNYTVTNVRGPVPVYSPELTLATGSDMHFTLTHRPAWIRVANTGPYSVGMCFSSADLSAGHLYPVPANSVVYMEADVKEVYLSNSATGSTTVAVMAGLTRETVADAAMPDQTAANWFPTYTASGSDYVLGVS